MPALRLSGLAKEFDKLPIEFSPAETKRFGIRCAKVITSDAPLKEIDRAARAQDIVLLSIRVATDDTARVQDLEDDGFRLMDTLVYYHRSLDGELPVPISRAGICIRAADPSDAQQAGALAARAFAGYLGHFHADRRLSQADADAVYVDWAKNSVLLSKPDLPVLVAEAEGEMAGFLASRKLNGDIGDITLNAVHPRMQGQGIYGLLLDHALRLLQSAGCPEVTISTQVNNITVQKAWSSRGLRMQSSVYTLHKWFNNSEA